MAANQIQILSSVVTVSQQAGDTVQQSVRPSPFDRKPSTNSKPAGASHRRLRGNGGRAARRCQGVVGVPVIAVPTSVGYGASYKEIGAVS